MKSNRDLLPVAVALLFAMAMAQSPAKSAAPSDAQKSFNSIKALAGTWQGPVTADPPQADWERDPVRVTMRITSRGNALVHEMTDPMTADDPTKHDHPLTMFYLDDNRLLLTHYCDAGNRPRMVAHTSPDGKKIDFDFIDVAGSTAYGHMQHATFTIIDANHHIEDWTYLMPGDKPVIGHLDLTRVQ